MRRALLFLAAGLVSLALLQTASARPGWAWMQFGRDIDLATCADTAKEALQEEGFTLADQHRWAWGAIYSGETSIHYAMIQCFERRGVMQIFISVATDREAGAQATRMRNRLAKHFEEKDETVRVPANLGVDSQGVLSKTVLEPGRRYRLTASGAVGFFPGSTDTDALYCYAEVWRPYFPELPHLCRALLVNGEGLDQLAGRAGKLAYRPGHRYEVTVTGVRGRLSFKSFDQAPGDNSGAWSVKIEALE
jgi:hypothetical protein